MNISDLINNTTPPVEGITAMQNDLQQRTDESNAKTYELLVQLGGSKVTEEQGITYIPGTAIGLPSDPMKMSKAQAGRLLIGAAENEEHIHRFPCIFKFRPHDGANALQNTLKKLFGVSGEGKTMQTMFGPNPPSKISVTVGVNKEVMVPWGALAFPLFDATLYTTEVEDETYGVLFQLIVEAPKKHEDAINGLFFAINQELKENSIYKGKSFVGVKTPHFFDPYKVKREQVVYADDVFTRLENTIWGVLRTAALQEAEGLPVNIKTILHGPYGTGKTLALGLSAQEANRNGWTFIQCHTGKDNLEQVMQTAALYEPCVVGVEDIDVLAKAGTEEANSRMLEMFDGLSVKNSRIMVIMTSNEAAELHKGMLRAGRVDAAIEIGALDKAGVEKLIKVNIPDGKLDELINWERVHTAMEGYAPAFIKETFVSAQRAAIIRTMSRNYRINTEDLVTAAKLLKPQHDLHDQAKAKADEPTLEQLFGRVVVRTLGTQRVDFHDEGKIVAQDEAA